MDWNFPERKTIQRLILIGTVIYVGFLLLDFIEDVRLGVGLGYRLTELTFATTLLAGCLLLIHHLLNARSRSAQLESQMLSLQQENSDWRRRTSGPIQALTAEIDTQLSNWQLSPAEKEIALLLLKGYANKEIARVRKTSEHTIKQQTSAIYRKSGLKTRTEISAFFLGDLLPIPKETPTEPPPNSL